jgi:hypothetical protein
LTKQSDLDLDARLEELRALGLSEPAIMDLVHRELMLMAANRRAQETLAPPSPDVSVAAAGEMTPLVPSNQDSPLAPQDRAAPRVAEPTGIVASDSYLADQGDTGPSHADAVPEVVPQVVVASAQLERRLAAYSSFAGPMPPPNYARAYEELCPGFTNRNLAMLEN